MEPLWSPAAATFVLQRIQPFRVEDEATKFEGANFVVASRFKPYAVRDGLLITGQQQYSGAAAARLIIEALGCNSEQPPKGAMR
jgi:putative intracellular protease/amidase